MTVVSRINVLRQIRPEFIDQLAAKDPRGICICQDIDYQAAYTARYSQPPTIQTPKRDGMAEAKSIRTARR